MEQTNLEELQKKLISITSEKHSDFDYKKNLEEPKSQENDYTKLFLEMNKNLKKAHQNKISRINELENISVINSLNNNNSQNLNFSANLNTKTNNSEFSNEKNLYKINKIDLLKKNLLEKEKSTKEQNTNKLNINSKNLTEEVKKNKNKENSSDKAHKLNIDLENCKKNESSESNESSELSERNTSSESDESNENRVRNNISQNNDEYISSDGSIKNQNQNKKYYGKTKKHKKKINNFFDKAIIREKKKKNDLFKKVKEEKERQKKDLLNIKIDFNTKNEFEHYPFEKRGEFRNRKDAGGCVLIQEEKNLNPILLLNPENINKSTHMSETENNLLKRLNSLKNINNTQNKNVNGDGLMNNNQFVNCNFEKTSNKNSLTTLSDTQPKNTHKFPSTFKRSIEEDPYKNFVFDANEIIERVLDFNFYRNNSDSQLQINSHSNNQNQFKNQDIYEEIKIPNKFLSKNHYRYIMRKNFFEEFKYSMLNSKKDEFEFKKYKNLKLKTNLIQKNNYLDSNLRNYSMNLLDKTIDIKKIFKENDVFAFISQKELMNNMNFKKRSTLNNEKYKQKNDNNFDKLDNISASKTSINCIQDQKLDIKINKKSNFDYNDNSIDDSNKKPDLQIIFEDIYDSLDLTNKNDLNYFLGVIKYEKNSISNKNDVTDFLCQISSKSLKNFNFSESDIFYIKFISNITSSIREYNAILEIDNTNFSQMVYNPENYIINSEIENENKNKTISSYPFLLDCNSKDENSFKKESFSFNSETFTQRNKDSKLMNQFLIGSTLKAIVDKSQFEALKYCAGLNDCVLIQGPPGTGKTHTIMCIISLFYNIPNSKILICAPSNSAIDEISIRLHTQGLLNKDFKYFKPDFIRFGILEKSGYDNKSQLNVDQMEILKNHTLEKMVENKFKQSDLLLNEEMEKLQNNLKKLESNKIGNSTSVKGVEEIEKKMNDIKHKIKVIHLSKIQNKNNKKIYEKDLLEKTRILCTTLNSSGHSIFQMNDIYYDFLIIDEACQCIEPSALIPMQRTRNKLVMVGDHIQLPATVFFPNATQTKYNRSLFERLIDNGFPKQILSIQYRMERNIRKFVGLTFYEDLLRDSILNKKNIDESIIFKIIDKSLNFSFLHLENSREKFCSYSKSYINELECEAIIFLIKNIQNKIMQFKDSNNSNYFIDIQTQLNFKFAIIAPYKAQVKYLIEEVDRCIPEYKSIIEINTVDSFQGREQDIVIISCVRSNSNFFNNEQNNNLGKNKENIGFLNDFRRMNVALSRAKFACFIVGDHFTLRKNKYWEKLLDYCKNLHNFFILNKEFLDKIKYNSGFDYLGLLSKRKKLDNEKKINKLSDMPNEDKNKEDKKISLNKEEFKVQADMLDGREKIHRFEKQEKNETLKSSQAFDADSIFHLNQIDNVNEYRSRDTYHVNTEKKLGNSPSSYNLNTKNDLFVEYDKLEDGELIEKVPIKFMINNDKRDGFNSKNNHLDILDEIKINKIQKYEFIDNKYNSLNDLKNKSDEKNKNFILTTEDIEFLKELNSIENCFRNKYMNNNKSEKEIYDPSTKSKHALHKLDNKSSYHTEKKNNNKSVFENNSSIVNQVIYMKENHKLNDMTKNNINSKEHQSNDFVNSRIIKFHSNENSYKNKTIDTFDRVDYDNTKSYKRMDLNLMEKEKCIYDSSGISHNNKQLILPLDEYCEIGINKKLSLENKYEKSAKKNFLFDKIDNQNINCSSKFEKMDNKYGKNGKVNNTRDCGFFRNDCSNNNNDSSQSALLNKKTFRNYYNHQS